MQLVGLYTYCKMMQGAYNVKPSCNLIKLWDFSVKSIGVHKNHSVRGLVKSTGIALLSIYRNLKNINYNS